MAANFHEDDLKGSDSDDVQYKPKILKTFKIGIDTITSITDVFNNKSGSYTAICSINSKELTFCNKDGITSVPKLPNKIINMHNITGMTKTKNLYADVKCESLAISDRCAFVEVGLNLAKPSGSLSAELVCDLSGENEYRNLFENDEYQYNQYITGICGLRNGDFAVCCASEQSYELRPKSRRLVAVYYGIHNSPRDFPPGKIQPIRTIEHRDSRGKRKSKERLFTYPKRVTESYVGDSWIGDLWIVDRKSPNTGDIKVCDIKGNLKFTYKGGPIGLKFDPMDVCSNQKDVLVIADCSNHKIHLVKNDGMFVQYLMTEQQGLELPTAICVDVFQRAWVGCDDGTVHIIRYFPKFEYETCTFLQTSEDVAF